MRKLKKSIADGDKHKKIKFYQQNIFWPWIPVFLIFLLIPISGVNIESIGIKWINIDTSAISKWIVFPTIGFYILYLLNNIRSIIILKNNRKSGEKAAKRITDDQKLLLPVTPKEKRLWTRLAISAGITEEILYRGYFFYALAIVFPNLSIVYILLISTIIFGIGHIYLGKEAVTSTILGLFFGIFYIVFDSVFPVIILHIAQDLLARDILEEEME